MRSTGDRIDQDWRARRRGWRAGPRWVSALGSGVLCVALVSGCSYTLPLGGIAPNQGRPLPERSLQLSLSGGGSPNMVGAMPEVLNEHGQLLNPIPGVKERLAGPGMHGAALGMAWGLTDRVDAGLSFSRGMYATVQLLEAGPWSLSLSPAYYRFTQAERRGDLLRATAPWSRLTNRNVTALAAFQAESNARMALDLYLGSGINGYGVRIRDQWREHRSVVPTALGGVTLDLMERERSGGVRTIRVALEATATWLTQRDGRRDLVTAARMQVALRSWPAW